MAKPSMSVFNGQTLGTITDYLEEHFDKLEKLIAAVEDTKQSQHYMRYRGNVTLDATGNGQVTFDVPPGYDWSMERVTVTSTGNCMCQVYLNAVAPGETVEIIGSSQIYSDAFANNIFAGQGARVIFAFTNAGNNGFATVNLQVKLLKRESKVKTDIEAFAE